MIDSNNINVMREKLRKVNSSGSGTQEEIERIDNLIGASPIPGTQRTITGSLNYLYDHALKSFEYDGNGATTNTIEFPEIPNMFVIVGYDGDIATTSVITVWGKRSSGTMSHGGITPWVGSSYDDNVLTINANEPGTALNILGTTYTVLYI